MTRRVDLRATARTDKFGHIVFYRFDDDHVDIWRVLHDHRDLPATLTGPDDPDASPGGSGANDQDP